MVPTMCQACLYLLGKIIQFVHFYYYDFFKYLVILDCLFIFTKKGLGSSLATDKGFFSNYGEYIVTSLNGKLSNFPCVQVGGYADRLSSRVLWYETARQARDCYYCQSKEVFILEWNILVYLTPM